MGLVSRLFSRIECGVGAVRAWDERMVRRISEARPLQPLARLFITASYLGDGYLWGGLGLGLILFGRQSDRTNVLIGVGITFVNVAIFRFLKLLFARRRPNTHDATGRFRSIDSYALPSGHATTSFGLAWLVSVTYPHPLAVAFVYLAAATISFSRIFVREHYPLDVIIGAGIGTLTSALLLPFFRWIF